MKLSIATDAISADFETAVLLGLEWGIEYFELKRIYGRRLPDISDDDVRAVQTVMKKNAVSLSTISPGLFKIALDAGAIAKEAGERFDMTAALADKLGTRSVVIFGFAKDAKHTEAEATRQIVDVFGALAKRAESLGLTLFLENDRGLWAESPESILRIVSGVKSRALRVNWDPCNLIGASAVPPFPAGFDIISDYVGHLHLKDALATADPSGFGHAMMGSGDVDWIGQFERLYRIGYSGFLVIEPHFGSRVESSRSHILETRRLLRLARARLGEAALRE
jgi:sugar phosphate isomerase/epimerase